MATEPGAIEAWGDLLSEAPFRIFNPVSKRGGVSIVVTKTCGLLANSVATFASARMRGKLKATMEPVSSSAETTSPVAADGASVSLLKRAEGRS